MAAHNAVASRLSRDLPVVQEGASLSTINTCFGVAAERAAPRGNNVDAPESSYSRELSVRALNVLKLLAAEQTGESPARKGWIPSDSVLRALTFEQLCYARNCGPQTLEEIVRWAGSRGIDIAPSATLGRSLSRIWRRLELRSAAGELTRAEIAEALDRSVRRKNTRIPLAVQQILLGLLDQAGSRRA